MKVNVLAVALYAALGCGVAAAQDAAEGSLMIRLRGVQIDTANKSDPVAGTGASDRIHVSKKTIPDIDISYFFTRNIAAELVLTYPQKHEVTLDGANIGSFKHLPPTLTVQYHFLPEGVFRPYVGAGVNLTLISDVNLLDGAGSPDHYSIGYALQAGADIKIAKNLFLNFDVKKVQIQSDVKAGGSKISAVQIDPWLYGVGIGWRF
ncbi:MAG: OmpW family protein [Betaproteobacteria bacterium]|nr:OmpW family protein [Betaproteobacteria bacterium]